MRYPAGMDMHCDFIVCTVLPYSVLAEGGCTAGAGLPRRDCDAYGKWRDKTNRKAEGCERAPQADQKAHTMSEGCGNWKLEERSTTVPMHDPRLYGAGG